MGRLLYRWIDGLIYGEDWAYAILNLLWLAALVTFLFTGGN